MVRNATVLPEDDPSQRESRRYGAEELLALLNAAAKRDQSDHDTKGPPDETEETPSLAWFLRG